MPYQSLAEAGAAVGRTRSAILKAIRRGAISAKRDEATGNWVIEPAELHRVFPAVLPDVSKDTLGNGSFPGETEVSHAKQTGDSPELRVEVRELRARLADKDDTIADLRHRLDQADTERRQTAERLTAAQERIAGLLTDQRPQRATVPLPVSDSPSAPARRRRWWRFGR